MLELRTGKFHSRQFGVEVAKVGVEFDIRGFHGFGLQSAYLARSPRGLEEQEEYIKVVNFEFRLAVSALRYSGS